MCLQVVIVATSVLNVWMQPERFLLLVLLQFLSQGVLTLTIALGLYTLSTSADEDLGPVSTARHGAACCVLRAVGCRV